MRDLMLVTLSIGVLVLPVAGAEARDDGFRQEPRGIIDARPRSVIGAPPPIIEPFNVQRGTVAPERPPHGWPPPRRADRHRHPRGEHWDDRRSYDSYPRGYDDWDQGDWRREEAYRHESRTYGRHDRGYEHEAPDDWRRDDWRRLER